MNRMRPSWRYSFLLWLEVVHVVERGHYCSLYTGKASHSLLQLSFFVAYRGAMHQLESFESNYMKYWGVLS